MLADPRYWQDYYQGPAPASPNRRSFLSAALATVTVAAVTGGAYYEASGASHWR